MSEAIFAAPLDIEAPLPKRTSAMLGVDFTMVANAAKSGC